MKDWMIGWVEGSLIVERLDGCKGERKEGLMVKRLDGSKEGRKV